MDDEDTEPQLTSNHDKDTGPQLISKPSESMKWSAITVSTAELAQAVTMATHVQAEDALKPLNRDGVPESEISYGFSLVGMLLCQLVFYYVMDGILVWELYISRHYRNIRRVSVLIY